MQRATGGTSPHHRVIWAGPETGKTLVVANDNVAEVWNLDIVLSSLQEPECARADLSHGVLTLEAHTAVWGGAED